MTEVRGTRRKARESALAYLYQTDLDVAPVTAEPQRFVHHFLVDEESREYFLRLVEAVLEAKSQLDSKIEESAENWKLYRMESVDRSILRLASFELLFCPETDFQIIIDEAVELAKEFGSDNSPSFVNGILDQIAKKVRQK
jgi:transcription antitermination protein NusB